MSLPAQVAELAASIAAHLAEDERTANAAAVRERQGRQVAVPSWTRRRSGDVHDEDDEDDGYVFGGDDEVIVYDEGSPSPAQADHIAPQRPRPPPPGRHGRP